MLIDGADKMLYQAKNNGRSHAVIGNILFSTTQIVPSICTISYKD